MALARLVFVLLVLTAPLIVEVETAAACSCIERDPRTALGASDGAIVGTLLERRADPSDPQFRAIFTFRVEEAVKGRFGDRLDVRSAANGAACGFELGVGQRAGLLLDRQPDGWHGNLCGTMAPSVLRAAAKPMPPARGNGAAVVVVGGHIGPGVRLAALDDRSRVVAYGRGGGAAWGLSVCPGSRRLVELVRDHPKIFVSVRTLPNLRRIGTAPVADAVAVSCRSADATEIAVFTSRGDGEQATSRLLLLKGGRIRVLHTGHGTVAGFGRTAAYVDDGAGITRVDFATAAARRVLRSHLQLTRIAIDPADARVAAIGYSPGGIGRSTVLAGRSDGRGFRSRNLGPGVFDGAADLHWTAARTLLVLPAGGAGRAERYDVELRPLRGFAGWFARASAVADGRAYGTASGRVIGARLPAGPVRLVHTFLSPETYAIAAVPRAERRPAQAAAYACRQRLTTRY